MIESLLLVWFVRKGSHAYKRCRLLFEKAIKKLLLASNKQIRAFVDLEPAKPPVREICTITYTYVYELQSSHNIFGIRADDSPAKFSARLASQSPLCSDRRRSSLRVSRLPSRRCSWFVVFSHGRSHEDTTGHNAMYATGPDCIKGGYG